jgi:hypothetical protein
MLNGVREEAWEHTSALMAIIINARPGVKKLIPPEIFNPMKSSAKAIDTKPLKVPLTVLRDVFVKK